MVFTKKFVMISSLFAFGYFTCIVLIHFNAFEEPNPEISVTTTTTTPTPLHLMLNKSHIDAKTIEKYDALKVHMMIMKEKIKKMTGTPTKSVIRIMNSTNSNVHMLYNNKIRHIVKKKNDSSEVQDLDKMMLLENLKMAQSIGAGVLILPHPYTPVVPQIEASENILNMLLNMAPMFNVKISIAIRENSNRNILSIRRDIFHFIEAHKDHPSLYKYKKSKLSKSLPVIYIMDSYMIPSNKWKELLSVNGLLTIRNSDIDAVILGHFQDEEHEYHVRQSNFDGFFTCCMNNGDSFGNTWKNWQSLSVWSESHDLVWSAGINEGPGGVLSIKTGLNTLLRCRSKPSFVFINNVPFKDDYVSLFQLWTDMWSDKISKNKYL